MELSGKYYPPTCKSFDYACSKTSGQFSYIRSGKWASAGSDCGLRYRDAGWCDVIVPDEVWA